MNRVYKRKKTYLDIFHIIIFENLLPERIIVYCINYLYFANHKNRKNNYKNSTKLIDLKKSLTLLLVVLGFFLLYHC